VPQSNTRRSTFMVLSSKALGTRLRSCCQW